MTAIRLTFSVNGGKPELEDHKRVKMRAPMARHTKMIDSEIGTWLETQDKDGKRRFACIVDSAVLSPMVEVRTGLGAPDVAMVKSRAKQLLHVVVPDEEGVTGFQLMRRDKKNGKAKSILSGKI